MNYYSFGSADHPKTSWALHEVLKSLPKRPRAEGLDPVFYRFFRSADVEVRIKPQYRDLCCGKCGRYESDRIFEVGFGEPVTIQFKGDYGYTNDRIFVIGEKYLKALKRAKVRGYETKPLGNSGWHALRVTLLVDHVEGAVRSRKPLCSACGQPRESFGVFECLGQLSLPAQANTFFATKTSWPSAYTADRPIFITEDALQVLREGGIAGGYCTRLLTEDELRKQKEKAKQGVYRWLPPGALIHLNGKVARSK
jgi:hypothetical protein